MTARLRAATAALALTALLAGCAAPGAPTPPATDPGPSVASHSSPPSAQPTATQAAGPMADWQVVRPESGRTQFRIPAGWSADMTFEEVYGEPVDGVIIRRPDGQQQLRFSQAIGDVGGICAVEGPDGISRPVQPAGELLDTAPILPALDDEEVAFGAVAVERDDGTWTFGMGITAAERLQEPLGCPFYFVIGGPGELGGILSFGTESQLTGTGEGSVWVVDSLDDARAYLETEEYATLKQILVSLESLV